MKLLKTLWLILTNPLGRAEELYQLAAVKLATQEAEVRFQVSRLAYYQGEVMVIDPTNDWWRYAQYKDKITEHRKLLMQAIEKQKQLRMRYVTCERKWRQLSKDLAPAPEPTLWTGANPPSFNPSINDGWIRSTDLVLFKWNGEEWVETT
jgi:hypothetical protein